MPGVSHNIKENMLYDVFISHASEDKNIFVRQLAEELKRNHIEVWYDEFSLKTGDSLRRSIDIGLSKSRFGLVVLSKNFFAKEWTQWELDGLVQRQLNSKTSLILPIWLNIEKKDVINYSPSLADIVAIKAGKNIQQVVKKLLNTIKPSGSTLIIARDLLIKYGFEPPVVTDDWWLDIIEYSGSNPMEGTFQESMGWGRWGFPLPEKNDNPKSRGKRLAWAAMQNEWQKNAEMQRITQITHPSIVLDFIDKQPGLREICFNFPHFLVTYAPQLTIKGFGGTFEGIFDNWLFNSLENLKKKSKNNEIGGTGLATNKKAPECDEPIALRHPKFGFYKPSTIVCFYVQGHLMGPPVKAYETIDYIAWLLSTDSNWLTKEIKTFLKKGMKEWGVWPWTDYNNCEFPFPTNKDTGQLFNSLYKATEGKEFKLTKNVINDITTRLNFSKEHLKLTAPIEMLVKAFLEEKFIEFWIKDNKKRNKKKK